MTKFNPNIHHRKSYRLKGYDYSAHGSYFLTICTQNREHFFGEIKNGKMEYTELGNIANQIWNEIPDHFPNFELDAFIVMPNHIHGIINIVSDSDSDGFGGDDGCDGGDGGDGRDGRDGRVGRDGRDGRFVGTRLIASLQNDANQNDANQNDANQNDENQNDTINNESSDEIIPTKPPGGATGMFNPMFYQNVSRVIRWYKGRCAFEMRKIHSDFKWQSRFYDHIIRDHDSYLRIAHYINDNPKNWEKDKFHSL